MKELAEYRSGDSCQHCQTSLFRQDSGKQFEHRCLNSIYRKYKNQLRFLRRSSQQLREDTSGDRFVERARMDCPRGMESRWVEPRTARADGINLGRWRFR